MIPFEELVNALERHKRRQEMDRLNSDQKGQVSRPQRGGASGRNAAARGRRAAQEDEEGVVQLDDLEAE